MAYNFVKLADVEALDSVPENANAFIEVDGEVKRVPGSGLGGSSNKTAILRLNIDTDDGTSALSLLSGGVAAMAAGDNSKTAAIYTATCENMTYDEVKAIFLTGESVDARLQCFTDDESQGTVSSWEISISGGYFSASGFEAVGFTFVPWINQYASTTFFWLPDGTITTDYNALFGG